MKGQNRIHNLHKGKSLIGVAVIGAIMFFVTACDHFEGGGFHGPTETIEETLSVGDTPVLVIENENGSIDIEAGAANTVQVEATLRRPSGVEFDISQDGDTITITAQAQEGFLDFRSSPGAEIKVITPPATQVDLRTSNGRIEVEGIQESGSLRTSNGRIVLNDVKGAFEARTSNGSIEFEGELSPGGDNELRTSNGSVVVELLGEPNVRIDATTSNGSVQANLPFTASSIDENHLSGTIGDGDAKLVVRTSNGSVTIR